MRPSRRGAIGGPVRHCVYCAVFAGEKVLILSLEAALRMAVAGGEAKLLPGQCDG